VIEDLPGVAPWAGGYVGLQGGYNFSGKTNAATGEIETNGFYGGGFAGVQGQTGQFVYGAEADVNYSAADGSNGVTASRTRIDGSLRGRAGVAVSDRVLVYGTAGGAAAKLRLSDAAGRDSNTMLGWTAGAGVDVKVTEDVFGRLEYRYTDYGSETFDTGSGPQRVSASDHRIGVGLGVRF
jgi:outer membrane immunogenic protein